MKFEDKQLLLFDLDGTLVDSVPDLAFAGNQMLSALGRNNFAEDDFRQWIGNGATVMVKRALSGQFDYHQDLSETLLDEALEAFFVSYRQHCSARTRLYPQVLETLGALKAKRYKMALITNKPFEFIAPICQALELNDFFELALGGDSLPTKKPDPAPLHHVCRHFDIDPTKTLMVGDSQYDILAAHNANMDSIGVSYGYNNNQDIGIYRPSAVVDSFAEILTLLPKPAAGSGV